MFFIILYILYALGDGFVLITKGTLDGCMEEMAGIMFQFGVPVVLALLLFDDSSYWLQLSTELIGDKKDYIFQVDHSDPVSYRPHPDDDDDHLLIPQSSPEPSESRSNQQNPHRFDIADSDLFINHSALQSLGLMRENSKNRALLADSTRDLSPAPINMGTPWTPPQRRQSSGSILSEPVISKTKHLYIPKLQESVGRFDSKANFDRVIDQLSMTIPVIKKSEIEFLGDSGFGSYSAVKKAKFSKTGELLAVKSLYSFDSDDYKYVVCTLWMLLCC